MYHQPWHHKITSVFGVLLQSVADGLVITVLPHWLAEEYVEQMEITLGVSEPSAFPGRNCRGKRAGSLEIDHLRDFADIARCGIDGTVTPARL